VTAVANAHEIWVAFVPGLSGVASFPCETEAEVVAECDQRLSSHLARQARGAVS
jgi:predicted RNase H-like HicB family nuclease